MKRILVFAAALLLMNGCKKVKENIIEQRTSSFLDGTEWKVVAFSEGDNTLDAAFLPYHFRFNANETVNAIRGNITEATGTWKANITERTMQAAFAQTAVPPLPLLNTTWTITQNTLSSLSATATVSGTIRKLRMEKK